MASSSASSPATFFFSSNPPPSCLPEMESRLSEFVSHHMGKGGKVVLCTSGGTIVPLERNSVRFVSNFSTGSRGAISAEHFLAAGYAVVFLHKGGSLQPFSRHFVASPASLLESLHLKPDGTIECSPQDANFHRQLRESLSLSSCVQAENRLLSLEFHSVQEYLYLLRSSCQALRPLKDKALVYLPAAVSDYYIPFEDMAEHKIQSKGGSEGLTLSLQPVPKVLGLIRSEWCSEAFTVSFKLETDESILDHKAESSIEKYGMHAVIGNLLQNYKQETRLYVAAEKSQMPSVSIKRREVIKKPQDASELESVLIPRVLELFSSHQSA